MGRFDCLPCGFEKERGDPNFFDCKKSAEELGLAQFLRRFPPLVANEQA